jgi:uncharacterized membrane protein YfcA
MEWYEWLLLPLIGAMGGFLAGMLGVGGGIIFIPLLTWLIGRHGVSDTEVVKYTLANSIFLVFVSGLSGIGRQLKKGELNLRQMLLIGIPGALTAWIWSLLVKHGFPQTTHFSEWLQQHGEWYQKDRFQMVFLCFLLLSIANMVLGKSHQPATPDNDAVPKGTTLKQLLVSVLAGTVVALSGLGGGVIMVPLFRMLLKMPMRQATGLSLSIIPLLSAAPLVSYLSSPALQSLPPVHSGYIVWPYAIPIAAAVAIFAVLGQKTASLIPEKTLRIIFASLSAIVLITTLYDIFTA